MRAVGLVPYAPQMLAGMHAGWVQSLDKLAALATAELADEFVVTREFDAPRELVYKAWTEPERLGQWWGPEGLQLNR